MMLIQPREDLEFGIRLAASGDLKDSAHLKLGQIDAWLGERDSIREFGVDRIPFSRLRGWGFREGTGDLVHDSGRFFSVQGLYCDDGSGTAEPRVQFQPIIDQPEIGILGILVKEFDGVPHFLLQAKMEPGNPRPIMLSPTVQATRSNYTRVHNGARVKYLEYFAGPRRGRVIADVLQSEHGDWFLHKRNRNIIMLVDGVVPVYDDFCWFTLGQIAHLLTRDNLVNMDCRTVLACLPLVTSGSALPATAFARSLVASRQAGAGAVLSTTGLLSWFTDVRTHSEMTVTTLPLTGLPNWYRTGTEIRRDDERHFRVVAVDVRADGREVPGWTQPMIEPIGRGLSAFLVREFDGVLHLLVHAQAEAGFRDQVEIGPTVQCMSEAQMIDLPPLFLDQIPKDPGSPRVHYQAVHAEEGGRFLYAEVDYMIVEADVDALLDPLPDDFAWITARQLSDLLRHSLYANVQARTLLACLNAVD